MRYTAAAAGLLALCVYVVWALGTIDERAAQRGRDVFTLDDGTRCTVYETGFVGCDRKGKR